MGSSVRAAESDEIERFLGLRSWWSIDIYTFTGFPFRKIVAKEDSPRGE